MNKKKPVIKPLPCATERKLKVLEECMRESQLRDIQQLRELETEPTMHNFDGFYSTIKKQEDE